MIEINEDKNIARVLEIIDNQRYDRDTCQMRFKERSMILQIGEGGRKTCVHVFMSPKDKESVCDSVNNE